MFDFLRRMIVPIMMIALIGFLATIIFQWGADINSRANYENSNLAAVINGEEVSWTTYNQVYENLIKIERDKTEDEITEEQRNEVHANAWSQIQYERLLLQEADKHNITVSDDELYEFLKYSPPQDFMQAPTFQTNGQFDYQKYVNALADPNFAQLWASYDPYFRSEIKKLKLQEMIVQSTHVTENEVQDYFVALNEKVKVGMVNVNFAKYARPGPSSTDEEMLEYYNNNLEKYGIDERAVLNIVAIEKKPTDQDWEDVRLQIQRLADTIAAGADFAEIAKSYSQDGSAQNGGDLGEFPEGQMVKEFNDMVFSMKSGEISPPVRTQFGWHLIKHFGYTTKDNVKKAKASHILLKVIASPESLDIANNRLNQFRTDALEIGFDEAAAKNDLTVRKTTPFAKNGVIPNLGRDAAATDFAFGSELQEISPVYENTSNQYVIQLVEKLPAGTAPFEAVKSNVSRDLVKVKIKEMCVDTANVIWSEIQNGTDIKRAAKNHGIEYDESDEIVRGGYLTGLGNYPEIIGSAFALQNVGDLSGPIDYEQGSIILKLIDKTPLDLTIFTAQKDSLSNILLGAKQQEVFGRWYEQLIDNSEIVNNIQTLRSTNRN